MSRWKDIFDPFGELPEKPTQVEPVKVWEPQDGDVLVLTSDHKLSPEAAARIRDRIREEFPNQRLMILDEGMQLEVIKQDVGR